MRLPTLSLWLLALYDSSSHQTHAFITSGGSRASFLSSHPRRTGMMRSSELQAKKKSSDSSSTTRSSRGKPSKVVDEDGPTPEPNLLVEEEIDPADIPELHYDPSSHPIPHQPWRRGETNGCEDPIESDWRREGERIIKTAARMVGGNVLDVTWYLTQVVITIDELDTVDEYTQGPEIVFAPDKDGPEYFDPDDPNPDPIFPDDEEFLYERDVEAEETLLKSKYAPKDEDDDDDDDEEEIDEATAHVPLFLDKETREDLAAPTEDEEARMESVEVLTEEDAQEVDASALSTIAKSILDALEPMEEFLHILERHEIILTSPGASDVLESQRQFDAYRGFDVIVETQDPFGSNRVLKGKLLTRNSMDLIINKKGRMVTIPLNFVKSVTLPPSKKEKGVPKDTPF